MTGSVSQYELFCGSVLDNADSDTFLGDVSLGNVGKGIGYTGIICLSIAFIIKIVEWTCFEWELCCWQNRKQEESDYQNNFAQWTTQLGQWLDNRKAYLENANTNKVAPDHPAYAHGDVPDIPQNLNNEDRRQYDKLLFNFLNYLFQKIISWLTTIAVLYGWADLGIQTGDWFWFVSLTAIIVFHGIVNALLILAGHQFSFLGLKLKLSEDSTCCNPCSSKFFEIVCGFLLVNRIWRAFITWKDSRYISKKLHEVEFDIIQRVPGRERHARILVPDCRYTKIPTLSLDNDVRENLQPVERAWSDQAFAAAQVEILNHESDGIFALKIREVQNLQFLDHTDQNDIDNIKKNLRRDYVFDANDIILEPGELTIHDVSEYGEDIVMTLVGTTVVFTFENSEVFRHHFVQSNPSEQCIQLQAREAKKQAAFINAFNLSCDEEARALALQQKRNRVNRLNPDVIQRVNDEVEDRARNSFAARVEARVSNIEKYKTYGLLDDGDLKQDNYVIRLLYSTCYAAPTAVLYLMFILKYAFETLECNDLKLWKLEATKQFVPSTYVGLFDAAVHVAMSAMKVNVQASFCKKQIESVAGAMEVGARITTLGVFIWACMESEYYGCMFLVVGEVLTFIIFYVIRQYYGIAKLRIYYQNLPIAAQYTVETKGFLEGIWTAWVGLWINISVPSGNCKYIYDSNNKIESHEVSLMRPLYYWLHRFIFKIAYILVFFLVLVPEMEPRVDPRDSNANGNWWQTDFYRYAFSAIIMIQVLGFASVIIKSSIQICCYGRAMALRDSMWAHFRVFKAKTAKPSCCGYIDHTAETRESHKLCYVNPLHPDKDKSGDGCLYRALIGDGCLSPFNYCCSSTGILDETVFVDQHGHIILDHRGGNLVPDNHLYPNPNPAQQILDHPDVHYHKRIPENNPDSIYNKCIRCCYCHGCCKTFCDGWLKCWREQSKVIKFCDSFWFEPIAYKLSTFTLVIIGVTIVIWLHDVIF